MPETILVVDDEQTVRETFLDWLAPAGSIPAGPTSSGPGTGR